MSAKLNIKAASGGSVSLVVDDTLTTDEEFNVSEGGIENGEYSGTDISYHWTKFPDGTALVFGYVYFRNELEKEIPYPFDLIIAAPTVTPYTYNTTVDRIVNNFYASDNEKGIIFRSNSNTEAHFTIMGRWK